MRGNPGQILQLSDGRKCIMHNKQPLLQEKGKVVLHLIDDNFSPINDETGKQKTLIWTVDHYNLQVQEKMVTGIGMID